MTPTLTETLPLLSSANRTHASLWPLWTTYLTDSARRSRRSRRPALAFRGHLTNLKFTTTITKSSLQLPTIAPAQVYILELFTIQPTSYRPTWSYNSFSTPFTAQLRFPDRTVAQTAPWLWKHLPPPEFRQFWIPPSSFRITHQHLHQVVSRSIIIINSSQHQ